MTKGNKEVEKEVVDDTSAPDSGDDGLKEFEGELDLAVDAVMSEKEEKKLETETDTEAETEEVIEEVEKLEPELKTETDIKDDDSKELSDDLLERAVKAGIPMSEAKQYPNPELLEKTCSRLEIDDSIDPNDVEEDSVDALLPAIPDLDPDEYDEKIVAGFNAMKKIIASQQQTIQSQQASGHSDWYATQVEGLGKGVSDALKTDGGKRDALKAKFDVLTAGYAAGGNDMDRSDVFQEAVQLVLGNEIETAKAAEKAAKVKKRNGQQISRSGGNRPKSKGDINSDIAAEIDKKYFSD